MQISKLIRDRLESSYINLTNPDGVKIDSTEFKHRYEKIKSFFASLPPQSTIGIRLPKNADYMSCMLAALETGICYVPMKQDFPKSRIEQIVDVCSIKEIIDQEKLDSVINSSFEVLKKEEPQDTDPAYMICTSGSTGVPKAVIISRSALSSFWKWQDDYFPHISHEDSLLLVTQFTFDISLVDVGFFLSKGCEVYFSKFESNIFELAFELETYQIKLLNTVPNNINMLLTEGVVSRVNLEKIKSLFIGGARFSYGLYEKCKEHLRDKDIYNFYGPTEATIYCTIKKIDFKDSDLEDLNVSIGPVFSHLESKLHENQLYISGNQVMSGYNKNPSKTKDVLTQMDGKVYYATGDIAFENERKELFITGRADDTIKYRGFRINLLDIDSYIMKLPYVQDSTTIALPDEVSENITVAFLITKEDVLVSKIKEDLESILLPYQIPVKIHFVSEYPLNVSGKVCKKTLLNDYTNGKRFYT